MENPEHYSSEEEEVFFGSLAQSEVSKRRNFLGENYCSPITPRPPRCNKPSGEMAAVMPDVLRALNTSTPVMRQQSTPSCSNNQLTHNPPVDSSFNESDDDIIVVANNSDTHQNSASVIVLSDDDSFIRNEEKCVQISGRNKDNESSIINSEPTSFISNKDSAMEVSDQHYGSLFSDKDFEKNSVAKDGSLYKSAAVDSENSRIALNNHSPVNGNCETIVLDYSTAEESCELKSEIDNSSSSLVRDINDFVGDSKILEKSSTSLSQKDGDKSLDETNTLQNLKLCSSQTYSEGSVVEKVTHCISIDSLTNEPSEVQNNIKMNEDIAGGSVENHDQHSLDMISLNDLDYSLKGVTDSILNISHGSSLPSPDMKESMNDPMHQQDTFYEDISYNGEHLDGITGISRVSKQIISDNEDLHMSVDEVDCKQDFSINVTASSSLATSINISQPSEYISCPSACSSYCTTYNDKVFGKNNPVSEQPDSFQNYRDVTDDFNMTNEADAISVKSDEGITNEASFELVLQNRQNSFNHTSDVEVPKKSEASKTKIISKLPVYQNAKSLLRPPKLHVEPADLKTSSYKFAKKISKVESEKTPSKICKLELLKSSGFKTVNDNKPATSTGQKEHKLRSEKEKTFTKTPAKSSTLKNNFILAKPITPVPSIVLSKSKTPSQSFKSSNKTPAQNLSGIPRAVKSDTKVLRAPTPLRSCNSSTEKSSGKSSAFKNRYKDVISPIHAYIRGSPPVSQVKAQVIHEEKEVYNPDGRKVHTSKSQKETPQKAVRKVVQKLDYASPKGQENVNPNVMNPLRDTIPSKILQPSLGVFWKETEHTKSHLPKMGEKHAKLLAGPPKVTVIVHEGRVNESPTSKGVFVKNSDNTSTSALSELLNVDDNCEGSQGRISVRFKKTAELP